MIVKNEASVIARCLESAMPIVDAAVIFDTGSTDDTIKTIREAFTGKPLFVFPLKKDVKWPYGEFDFGTARTEAARVAKQIVVKEYGFKLDETYLLFLDADMVLVREETFDKNLLTGPHYRLIQKQGTFAYANTRLGRLDFDWVSVEPTHEYWAPSPDKAPPQELFSLWIDDRNDGGSHDGKNLRDIRLLQKRLEADPKNVRAMYYLAQTYYYLAGYWFEKRAEAGGWAGEKWYAKLMLGRTLAQQGERERSILTLLDAADSAGARAEPMAELATAMRVAGKNNVAYGFAHMALERDALPKDQTMELFVDREAKWRALEEVSISAFYVGKMEEGRQACERILRQPGLPYHRYELAARNLLHYLPKEYDAVVRRGRFEVPKEMRVFKDSKGEDPVEYLTSSPSIVATGDEYLVNIRLVNYDHERGRWFVARHKDGVIRTENTLSEGWHPYKYDSSDFPVRISQTRISESWPKGRILGLEDVRLCRHGVDVWFTATTCQTPKGGDKSKVVLGNFRSGVFVLEYEHENEYEKNWLPWSIGGKLFLIYGYEPFVVLEPIESGDAFECQIARRQTMPFRMARYRGGAAPVNVGDNRWLMLIHEVAHRDNDNVYLHRFIELDESAMLPTRVSEAFTFHHQGVEYAAGMARNGKNLIVTYGAEERESHWCEVDPGKIRWMPPAEK
jgi:glycosyltransferase involved in cell wall biosynthesis